MTRRDHNTADDCNTVQEIVVLAMERVANGQGAVSTR
jgi:hypothetical protein